MLGAFRKRSKRFYVSSRVIAFLAVSLGIGFALAACQKNRIDPATSLSTGRRATQAMLGRATKAPVRVGETGTGDLNWKTQESSTWLKYFYPFVDSNSPSFWANDQFCTFTSRFLQWTPTRNCVDRLSAYSFDVLAYLPGYEEDRDQLPDSNHAVVFVGPQRTRWIEAVVQLPFSSELFGWYHNEVVAEEVCPGVKDKVYPQIGALHSVDGGKTWTDLGIVLNENPKTFNCSTPNAYFVGGAGDFSVVPNYADQNLYLVYSAYGSQLNQQGIALARISFNDLISPIGRVWKWNNGNWNEPGLGGQTKALIPAVESWHKEGSDVLWGPSIHWNSYLERYVILASRAGGPDWLQKEAVVFGFDDIANPPLVIEPQSVGLLGWYSQLVGDGEDYLGTDRLSGRNSKLFSLEFPYERELFVSHVDWEWVRTENSSDHTRLFLQMEGLASRIEQRSSAPSRDAPSEPTVMPFRTWSSIFREVTGYNVDEEDRANVEFEDLRRPMSLEEWWSFLRKTQTVIWD